jgi:hypothetical protein
MLGYHGYGRILFHTPTYPSHGVFFIIALPERVFWRSGLVSVLAAILDLSEIKCVKVRVCILAGGGLLSISFIVLRMALEDVGVPKCS